jgi:hypothetical protein
MLDNLRIDHHLHRSDVLLSDAIELREEAERHKFVGNDDEASRLLVKHDELLRKHSRHLDKAEMLNNRLG